jgi:hypothetical protein
MFGSIGIFDSVASEGDRFLRSMGLTPVAAPYLDAVAETYETLAGIHDQVVDVSVKVSEANSIDEAREALTTLSADNLRYDLKMQGLCDTLENLGHQLRQEGYFPELTESLERGERGTAEMYATNLVELIDLPDTVSSLDSLKTRVDDISDRLVLQKARFDLLAKKLRAKQARGY